MALWSTKPHTSLISRLQNPRRPHLRHLSDLQSKQITMGSKSKAFDGDKASPGKIFIGGLSKDATLAAFTKYFEKYGEIIDSVIMKDRNTGHPRGFGFVTYADPSVVDTVIDETHVINGKQVEIKRTIPKGAVQSKDFRTKKVFVGGVPMAVTEDEFKNFFSKYGKVVEHQIIRDHETNRSRGFGFIVFDNEQVVDDLLANGNRIDMDGTQVEVKKAEPKKTSNPQSAPAYASDSRIRPMGDSFGGLGDLYGGFGSSGFGPASYRTPSALGNRFGDYGGYGSRAGEFSSSYGSLGGAGLGSYPGEPPLSYTSRLGSYGGLGGGYGGALGGYSRRGEGYGSYGSGFDSGFESGPGASYGGPGGLYGSRAGYSGSSRYHPYSR